MYKQRRRWWWWWCWVKSGNIATVHNTRRIGFFYVFYCRVSRIPNTIPSYVCTVYTSYKVSIYVQHRFMWMNVCACVRWCWWCRTCRNVIFLSSVFCGCKSNICFCARAFATHFPCICFFHPMDGVVYICESLRLPLFRGMRLRRQNVLSHKIYITHTRYLHTWASAPQHINSFQFNSIQSNAMWCDRKPKPKP